MKKIIILNLISLFLFGETVQQKMEQAKITPSDFVKSAIELLERKPLATTRDILDLFYDKISNADQVMGLQASSDISKLMQKSDKLTTIKLEQILLAALENAQAEKSSSLEVKHVLASLFIEPEISKIFEKHGVAKQNFISPSAKGVEVILAPKTNEEKNQRILDLRNAVSSFITDYSELIDQNLLEKPEIPEKDLRPILKIMLKRKGNNPILLGEAGVGKTARAEAIAFIFKKQGKKLIEVKIGDMIAGTDKRGASEERIKNIVEYAKLDKSVVLFIDEAHLIMGAGKAEGSGDMANLMKPALARGEICTILATTLDEFREHIEKDPAMLRRVKPVFIYPPNKETTLKILNMYRLSEVQRIEKNYGIKLAIKDTALDTIYYTSDNYVLDVKQPASSIDLFLDMVASFEYDLKYTDKHKGIKEITLTEMHAAEEGMIQRGIPAEYLVEGNSGKKIAELNSVLKSTIAGREKTIDNVSKSVAGIELGLSSSEGPKGILVIAGKKGSGKRTLVKRMYDQLFPGGDRLYEFDGLEDNSKESVSTHFGSSRGYVGSDKGGSFIEFVRRRPHSMVVVENVEELSPKITGNISKILRVGRMSDANKLHTADFKSTLWTFVVELPDDFAVEAKDESERYEKLLEYMRESEEYSFLLKRMKNLRNHIFLLDEHTEESLDRVMDIKLEEIKKNAIERDLLIEVEKEAKQFLSKKAFELSKEQKNGGNSVNTIIESFIEDTIVEKRLKGEIKKGDQVNIRLNTQTNCLEFFNKINH